MSAPAPAPAPALSAAQHARLDGILLAAQRGWHVFPLLPATKAPALHSHDNCSAAGGCAAGHQGWEHRATTNPDRIGAFWRAHPDHNAAIATGPSGLVVLDLDQPRPGRPTPEGLSRRGITTGAQVLDLLARTDPAAKNLTEPLPATYTVSTPSGGTHLYYRAPAGAALRSTAGRLGWLIDTRAHGGYVVAPGSTLPSGGYELTDDTEPADLPTWLHQALTPKPAPASSEAAVVALERLDRYLAVVARDQAERVRHAPAAQHNKTVFVAACRLGELVGARALDSDTAHLLLKQSAAYLISSACRCTERELDDTIRSGLRIGALRPRSNLPARATGPHR